MTTQTTQVKTTAQPIVVFSGRDSLYGNPNALPAPLRIRTSRLGEPRVIRKPEPPAKKATMRKAVSKSKKDAPLCACGCKQATKGGIYKPGHDSKHRSKLAGPKVLPLCKCGCGVQTKGGTFRIGHDAKFKSQQLKAEREAAEQKKVTKAAKKAKVHVMAASGAA